MSENILHSTTQKFLDIFDITNNMVILKDGTCSVIIQVDAMNFGLLAEEEQDSIMYAYAGLLNSLNYPIQVIIHSQTKDVTGYLQILKDQEDESKSRTQQQRIRRYREFVSNLIRERNVLDKKFYVSISAAPIELGIIAPQNVIPGQSGNTSINPEQRTAIIEKARNLLEPKRDHLLAQFARIGLFARQLATQEIIQFFYVSYNPEAAEGQQIADTSNYTTPLVTAGVEGVTMNDAQTPSANQPTPVATAAAAQAEQQGVPATPVPQPETVPPQLAPDAPVTPPSEITPPEASTQQPETTQTAGGYTPTQMPATPTPAPAPTPEVATTPQPTPTPTEQTTNATTPTETPAATPEITPEPTTPIEKPDTQPAPATPVVEETPKVEPITEAEQTKTGSPVPQSPEKEASAEPASASAPATPQTPPKPQGPTLASTTGESDLPKPTLPNMQPATDTPATTPTPSEPKGAVIDTSSVEEPSAKTSPEATANPTPTPEPQQASAPATETPQGDKTDGEDLPPLPEI